MIPKEISELTALQALVMNDNTIEGPLPETIGSLRNLTDLDLEDNFLEGTLCSRYLHSRSYAVFDYHSTLSMVRYLHQLVAGMSCRRCGWLATFSEENFLRKSA
jgi:Leucine-rich repeat (LRR) protein